MRLAALVAAMLLLCLGVVFTGIIVLPLLGTVGVGMCRAIIPRVNRVRGKTVLLTGGKS